MLSIPTIGFYNYCLNFFMVLVSITSRIFFRLTSYRCSSMTLNITVDPSSFLNTFSFNSGSDRLL